MTKILVIEDTKSLLEEIIETLYLEGFEAKGAENGAIGVEVAKQYLPDLVICDVMMPELNGYGTLAALQNYLPTSTTPFIFLTAKADRDDMRQGMELGANDYLTKPFTTSELLKAIAAQLKKIQALESHYDIVLQTAITKHEQKLRELKISNDPVTNLPNRIAFYQQLQESLIYAHTHHCSSVLILIDIDNFHIVNNALGSKIGDTLIKAIAERLRQYLAPSDALARLQNERLGLILSDRPESELKQCAQNILDLLSKPYSIFGHEVFITACLGITIYPQDRLEASSLIKNADMALYYAQAQGRNNYKFYSSNLDTRLSEQMAIENSLRRAFERKEFRLYYQPIVNSRTNQIIGAEALLRWQHPDLGIVLPEKFIPIAENIGTIATITEWVIQQACHQLKIWQQLIATQIKPEFSSESKSEVNAENLGAISEMYMAVNLSACSFKQDRFTEAIANTIKAADINHSHINLEISEATIGHNAHNAIASLRELQQLGVKIAIDDFGVGYTSFGYLKHFSVDKIKIDKFFIQDVIKDRHSEAIAVAIIELALSLNLSVVAEGVETIEQLNFLQHHHCDLIQGYLFSPPLPAEQFTQLLIGE